MVWLAVAALLAIRKITLYQSFVKYIRAGREEVGLISRSIHHTRGLNQWRHTVAWTSHL